jgi:hypothetical protein
VKSLKIILFVLLIEIITNYGNNFLAFILFLITLLAVGQNFKKNFKYLILIFLISDDQSRFLSDPINNPIYSIYTIPNLTMVITIILFIISFYIYFIKRKVNFRELKLLINFFRFIVVVGLFFGIFNIFNYPRIVIHDLSYFVNTFAFLVITFHVYFSESKSKEQSVSSIYFKDLLSSIVIAISVKYLILSILFILGNGEVVGNMIKVTGETGKSLSPLYASIFLLLYIFNKNKKRFLYLFMFLISILITLTVASRSTLVLGALSIVTVVYISNISTFKKQFFVLYSISGLALIIFIIEFFQPGAMANVLWKLSSIDEIDLNARQYSSLSALTRFIEVLNIYYMHIENYTIVFGSGFGSYFVDTYVPFPFILYDTDTFKDEWITNGTFFKPHTTPIYLFLKIGLGGLIYYYGVFLKIYINLIKKIKLIPISIEYCFALAILPNMFIIITKNFSSKMQIALGIYMAILFISMKIYERKNTQSS